MCKNKSDTFFIKVIDIFLIIQYLLARLKFQILRFMSRGSYYYGAETHFSAPSYPYFSPPDS